MVKAKATLWQCPRYYKMVLHGPGENKELGKNSISEDVSVFQLISEHWMTNK